MVDHWVIFQEKKREKYLNLTRELKKLSNMKVTVIPIINDPQKPGEGAERIKSRRMSCDHYGVLEYFSHCCWLLIPDTFSFFLPHLNSLASLLSVKAAKELLVKRRKEVKIPFIFWLNFQVQQLFCGWGNYFWMQMKWLHLRDVVLKCVSHLRWLISLNSVFLCSVVFSCSLLRRVGSLTADATCMWSPQGFGK